VNPPADTPPDAAESAPSDCLRCGVCCFSRLPTYVRVTGEDWARLGDDAGRWAHFIGHRAYLRMHDGHCAALETRPSPEGGTIYFCAAYERRPQTCRDLQRGSPECAGERATKGGRPGAQAVGAGVGATSGGVQRTSACFPAT